MVSARDPARQRLADALAGVSLLLVLIVLLALVGRPLATDDLWWHLKLGEVYASQGPWVPEDPLYHTTQDRPTVPHEWLYQVGVHWLERGVGFQGLRVAHVLTVAGIALWVFRIFARVAGGLAAGALAPAALATIVFLELSWFRLFQFRPDLVSVLALLAVYGLLLAQGRPSRRAGITPTDGRLPGRAGITPTDRRLPSRARIAPTDGLPPSRALIAPTDGLPPSRARIALACGVFLLWVNMHSLFAIGLALLVAALLGVGLRRVLLRVVAGSDEGRDADAALARRLALVLALTALVTLANPRGLHAHTLFLVESASGDIWQLQDDFLPWNPFWPAVDNRALTPLCWAIADALLLATAWTSARALLRVARERSAEAVRDLDAVYLGLAAASFVAMLVTVRFHWMALFPLVYVLRAARRAGAADPREARITAWVAATASVGLALLFPGGIHIDSYAQEVAAEPDGYRSPYLDQRYCGAGTRFLEDAGIQGRLFHPFNLGGFLGYWLAPDLRTFIDGRMDHYPSEVLTDYMRIRRASQVGAGRVLWKTLDKWDVDVFFGTSFPESRYSDRFWVSYIRRLPGWIPIWASQTHSIYLRRNSRNARNLTLAKAWFMQRMIPFSLEKGLDVGAAIERRPAWAVKQGVVPPDYAHWLEESRDPDPLRRRIALAELGRVYWQVGAFEKQVAADQQVVALDPGAVEARRRLADGLLHLKRPHGALEVARALFEEDPEYRDIEAILQLARQMAARSSAGPRAR